MEGNQPQDRQGLAWGIAVSLALHVLAALMLTGVVSGYVTEPLRDAIEVELVPPPEQVPPVVEPEVPEVPEPEVQEPEAQAPEAPEPDQAEPAETLPPPPPPAPQQPDAAETQPAEVPVLQPVEEFGEEDAGPVAEEAPPEEAVTAEAPEEAEATEEAETPEEPGETETPLETAAEDTTADIAGDIAGEADLDTAGADADGEAEQDAETEAEPIPDPEETPQDTDTAATPVVDPAEETDAASGSEADADIGVAEIAAVEDFGVVGPIVTEATPAAKPARTARATPAAGREPDGQPDGQTGRTGTARPPAGMLAARELYSRDILDAPQARTAMRGMSEGQRLNLLCMTELRAQITAVSALPPELLPSFRPPPGNVLQPATAAFRSLGRWFDVAFRCETDSGVTRVENFAFKIGREIPQGQWLERGLTGF